MVKEELKEGTSVFTGDGHEAGKISRFVLDPKTLESVEEGQIHLVVSSQLLESLPAYES